MGNNEGLENMIEEMKKLRFKQRKERQAIRDKEKVELEKAYNKLDLIEKIAYDDNVERSSIVHIPIELLLMPFKMVMFAALFGLAMLVFGINILEPLRMVILALFQLITILVFYFFLVLFANISNASIEKKKTKRRLLLGK